MQSSGGVAPAAEAARAGAWSVLSGPAGGAVGAGLLARASGDGNALGFDMGGTSCDVCVVEDGRVRRTDSRQIGGRVIQLPMVDVHTVGAGGGSIGWRDRGRRAAGRAALGGRRARARLLRARRRRADGHRRQPAARLPGRRLAPGRRRRPRRRGRRGRRSTALAATARARPAGHAAEGIVRVANQEMVRALRVVTVERGVDPRGFALMPFGGAGPMHAAAIAAELGIETDPLPAGQRRALGARPLRLGSPPRHRPHRDAERRGADRRPGRGRGRASSAAGPPGLEAPRPRSSTRCATAARPSSCRSRGRPIPTRPSLRSALRRRMRCATATATPTESSSWSTSASRWSFPGRDREPAAGAAGPTRARARRARFGGEWVETPVLRGEPAAGLRAEGPGVFELPEATLVLPPGWRAEVDEPARSGSRPERKPRNNDERARPDHPAGAGSAACAPPATRWARC